ncbi:MAG: glycosyltransferase [Acidobacteriota bacterium]
MAACRLSVIIASYNSRDTIGACLRSLESQADPDSFEIIVIDSSNDGTAEFVEQNFSQAEIYRFAERKFCGDARNIGITKANGEVVAFIDADCLAGPSWVEDILRAHDSSDLAIGGAIANGNPESYVGWAAYFTEFSKWMPGTRPDFISDIAGANMSYKTEIFERYGRFIEGTYCSDTEFHWRLGQDGLRLRFVPSIVVSHCNIEHLGKFLKHEIFHGRSFARVRIRARRFSRRRRFVYALGIPLVAGKLLLEIGMANLINRHYLKYFIRTMPLVSLGVACWCAGEFIGYLEKEK